MSEFERLFERLSPGENQERRSPAANLDRIQFARRLDRAAELVSRRLRKYQAGSQPRVMCEGQRLALRLVANALRDGDDLVWG
jgi:hypothetical protein